MKNNIVKFDIKPEDVGFNNSLNMSANFLTFVRITETLKYTI